jgi:cytochrome c-type biogenesis protein CcmH/NrfG
MASGDSNQKETNTPAYIDELKALASLRDDGIITEEEFQKQKAEILANH